MRARRLVLALWFIAAGASAQAPQQQLNTTLENLAKTKEAEAALKQKIEATESDMQAMRERAAGLAEQLQKSEQRVTSQEEALDKVTDQLSAKRSEFESRKADYAATVLSLLRVRNVPPTAVFSSADDIQQLLRTASVLEKTNAAVAAKATRLRSDMSQLKKLQTDAKQRDITTRSEKEKLRSERENLARELAARQKLQAKLSADHARAEAKVAALSRESESLQELIGKLAENEKTQAAPAKKNNLRSFDGKKGSLRAPVAGEIVHRFGDRQASNGTYRGMVFKTRAGATVVAPYDGEVAFTGPFRDYGNMVLIKHKNGYISLIAGLGKINTSLNQAAIRGEPIGTMPESGNAEAYVELRDSAAKPIDPADWFANVVGKSAP
jgi:septal ring factor EnvC (AmiA/AmiB activator)